MYRDGRSSAITVSFVSSNAQRIESYLFEGNVEFVMGFLLLHALAVVVVEDSNADEDDVIVSTEDPVEEEDAVVAIEEDSDPDVSAGAELEIGDTVR